MNLTETFISIVQKSEQLPTIVRENAAKVSSVDDSSFDESSIEFLDGMIKHNARGAEWTERLKKRRVGLLPLCGQPYLYGHIDIEDQHFSIYVHPETETVIYWEEY